MTVYEEEQLRNTYASQYTYFFSHIATDLERNTISLAYSITDAFQDNTAIAFASHSNGTFMISVDSSKIKVEDRGTHNIKITTTDNESAFSNDYTFQVFIVYINYDNPAPVYGDLLPEVKVDVDENILTSDIGYPVPVYSYFSKEIATDADLAPYDTVVMEFVIVDGFECACVTLAHISANDTFKLEVDRSKVTVADQGDHKIQVLLKDNSTLNTNVYQFNLRINFISANIVLPDSTTSDPQPVPAAPVITPEVPTEEETTTTEPEEEPIAEEEPSETPATPAGSVSIAPLSNPWVTIASKAEVTKAFNSFKPQIPKG